MSSGDGAGEYFCVGCSTYVPFPEQITDGSVGDQGNDLTKVFKVALVSNVGLL